MDRQAVLRKLPVHIGFEQASEAGKLNLLIASIDQVLSAIESDHGQPDAWEAVNIEEAVKSGAAQMPTAGAVSLLKALAEPGTYEISAQYPVPDPGDNPLARLRNDLAELARHAPPEE